jgi:hypothetical protein
LLELRRSNFLLLTLLTILLLVDILSRQISTAIRITKIINFLNGRSKKINILLEASTKVDFLNAPRVEVGTVLFVMDKLSFFLHRPSHMLSIY